MHTPGPWRIIGYAYEKGNKVPVIGDDLEEPVATVARQGDLIEVEGANARLIAAAPELLAVVKEFFDDQEREAAAIVAGQPIPIEESMARVEVWRRAALAAIAKAEGS